VNVNWPSPPDVFFVISKFPVSAFEKATVLVAPTGTVTVWIKPDVLVQPGGGVLSVNV
jgi:hypothetical protein